MSQAGARGAVVRAAYRAMNPAEIIAKRRESDSSSGKPRSRRARSRNSGEAPHQAGTRSGSRWANAASTLSREVMALLYMMALSDCQTREKRTGGGLRPATRWLRSEWGRSPFLMLR